MNKNTGVVMDIHDEDLKPYIHIHQLHRPPSYTLSSHHHAFWQMIFVTDGQLHVKMNSGTAVLSAGMLIILPPKCEHSLYSPHGYSQLGLDLLADCSERGIVPLLEQYFTHPRTLSSEHLLTLVTQIPKLHTEDLPLSKARTLNLLDSLVISCIETMDSATAGFKEQLVNYLDANLHCALRLSEIAEHFSISIPQLERRCRRYYNSSVIGLLQQHRLRKAQNLLISTELTIREIGCIVGYPDPAHFSSFFRNYTGVSPREYRTKLDYF